MKLSIPLLGACLLAASTALYAQAPQTDRHEKMKAAHSNAEKACEGKQGDARRDCMRKQMCAQAKDPKACLERTAKMKAAHAKAEKACAGKEGDARRDCMRHEMCAQAKDPAKCEARAKAARERREQKK
ncbi:MAG TPA: hypothetical protein VLJ12_07525 [Burkholderiales bacterium]|nr:hypothetical protein [Burkholderiales bacterium]